jgi:DNA-binding XRE family transcriptional regulator
MNLPSAMFRSRGTLCRGSREELRSRRRAADPTRRRILDELIAARLRAGLTQQQVADRLRTTRSAISRLEGGVGCRPTLTTIENYALVVGCSVEIKLSPFP